MKKRKTGILICIAAAAFMALCGCDNGAPKVTEDVGTDGIETRITGELLIDDSDDTISEYPVTINETVIKGSPESVICLSSSLTEMIFELGYGDRIIGRGSYCCYPDSVLSLTDYGKPAAPDLDAIKRAAPDLLITATSIPSKDVTALTDLGIPVLYIASPRSVDEFGRIYCALGMVFEGLFDGEKSGNSVFGNIKNELTSRGVTLGKFIYVTEGGFIAGGDTFESSVLSLFGENAASGASGYGYDKTLLKEDQPDVIILNNSITKNELLDDEILGKLDAAVNGRIITLSSSYFESPSGRITALVNDLSEDKAAEN
ncbi:MAG: ABC transporter substrate-binding protein [Ruminiclostridium sp.]|nr:ABC transporter substrate-binding protein [Ruminiclostridium sp.]